MTTVEPSYCEIQGTAHKFHVNRYAYGKRYKINIIKTMLSKAGNLSLLQYYSEKPVKSLT